MVCRPSVGRYSTDTRSTYLPCIDRVETANKEKKYTSKLNFHKNQRKKQKDNKPCILAVLRHIFAIFSSQISTMIGTLDAIFQQETTNRRWEIYQCDVRSNPVSLLSMVVILRAHFFPARGFQNGREKWKAMKRAVQSQSNIQSSMKINIVLTHSWVRRWRGWHAEVAGMIFIIRSHHFIACHFSRPS